MKSTAAIPREFRSPPYRICPIGAHSDHDLGKITGSVIDKGIHIAFRPKQNGVIEGSLPIGSLSSPAAVILAWMYKHSVLHSMEMPGSRYDIGNLESCQKVQETYRGITR